jgi:acyl-CoA thioesterase I
MAWSHLVRKIGAVCVVWPLIAAVPQTSPVHAQQEPDRAGIVPGQVSPLSKDCQTPGLKAVLDKPLPNTLTALRDRKVIKILTIGASASVGMDAANGGYQDVIEDTLEKTIAGLDVQIVDRGISGELARDAVERMKTEVALTEPDLVLWQVGTNDALAQIPVDEFSETVTGAIRWLKERNLDVALVGLQYIRNMRNDPHYQAIRVALAHIAENEKILRISRYEAMEVMEQVRQRASEPPLNPFALTEEGYSCMSEYVVRAITSAVFLKRSSSQPTN